MDLTLQTSKPTTDPDTFKGYNKILSQTFKGENRKYTRPRRYLHYCLCILPSLFIILLLIHTTSTISLLSSLRQNMFYSFYFVLYLVLVRAFNFHLRILSCNTMTPFYDEIHGTLPLKFITVNNLSQSYIGSLYSSILLYFLGKFLKPYLTSQGLIWFPSLVSLLFSTS